MVDMKEKPLVLDVKGRKHSEAKDVEKILNGRIRVTIR